jgi:hypothetical protein
MQSYRENEVGCVAARRRKREAIRLRLLRCDGENYGFGYEF